ncbi:TIGR02444 family protein [Reyranella sp.]|uniref:TIGR02444 family protein n=1 Tax=Reyranella sp. TaxID=1929291 RepID=UPI0025DA2696|nr:TIGR02444 family protein [Reyranella sp.]
MSDFLPHPFWNFSLELYGAEGVAEACLDLQDRRGCDVNVLLFCCWLAASGRPTLSADRLRAILKASDAWQADVVKPLRAIRRKLKDGSWAGALPETVEAVRRRVADAELAAEHAEQLELASLHMPLADRAIHRDEPPEKRMRAAVGNLGVYAVCLGVVPDEKDRVAVATLMRATFPALVPVEIADAVGLQADRVT